MSLRFSRGEGSLQQRWVVVLLSRIRACKHEAKIKLQSRTPIPVIVSLVLADASVLRLALLDNHVLCLLPGAHPS